MEIECWDVQYTDEVHKWLSKLDDAQALSVAKEIKALALLGNKLSIPHSKSIGAGLFELRERGYGLRVYYCFQKGKIILLLAAGNKTSQKRDIEKAKQKMRGLK